MPDIFLSYSRDDSLAMEVIRDNLRALGFNVWIDEEYLAVGTPEWETAIEEAVRQVDALVVIMTPHSKVSRWVNIELRLADLHSTPIFPVLAAGAERNAIPARLLGMQYADVRGRSDYEAGFHQLVAALAAHTGLTVGAFSMDFSGQPRVQLNVYGHNEGNIVAIGGDVAGDLNVAGRDVVRPSDRPTPAPAPSDRPIPTSPPSGRPTPAPTPSDRPAQAAASATNVWAVEEGEVRSPGIVHVVMLALLTIVGIVVGRLGSLAVQIGPVSAFWPGQAVQSIGSIWFGLWGGIAAGLFPLISNSLSGSAPLVVSMAYLPGNILQGMIAGYFFRCLKAHPALESGRDWVIWIVWGAVVPNAIGVAWGSTMLVAFGLITSAAQPVIFLGWFIGDSLPTIILGSIILKFVSPLVIRNRAFVKGYWA